MKWSVELVRKKSFGIMKAFGFSLLFLLFLFSPAFIGEGKAASVPALDTEQHVSDTTMTVKGRKLKGSGLTASTDGEPGTVNLEDYRPIDPVPSSKASVRPGPIQHATPLMPYIPKPSPPPTPSRSTGGVFP